MKRRKKSRMVAFPKFEMLRELTQETCHEQLNVLMNQLRPKWRDKLCDAAILYAREGSRTCFSDSRVMTIMFQKVTRVIILKNVNV